MDELIDAVDIELADLVARLWSEDADPLALMRAAYVAGFFHGSDCAANGMVEPA